MISYTEIKTGYCDADVVPPSRDRLLETLVTGSADYPAVEKYCESYNLDFPWRTYHVGLVDIGRSNIDQAPEDGIKSLVESHISGNFFGYAFEIEKYIGILFRNVSPLSLPRILRTLQEKVRDTFGLTVSISMGSSVDSLSLLPKSYMHAVKLLEQRFLYGHKQIIIRTEETNVVEDTDTAFDAGAFSDDTYCAMDTNNIVAVNDLLEGLKNLQIKCRSDEGAVRSHYSHLYLSVIGRLDEGCASLREYVDEKAEVLEELGRKSSLQELHGFMKFKLLSISEAMCCHAKGESRIGKILDYIDRNHYRDIKLEGIAALFDYNSTYLGKLFRDRTGQYFNTYMDRLRVEKAKLLLKEGLKVYQVAENVGICDIDYFHKKFKKYTGLSPSAFKGKT